MPIPEKGNDLCRLSAKDIIYRTVCEWIITGVLRPGEKILDSELARHFSVSRTPVREALQVLESQKLICVRPGRATVVAELDVEGGRRWLEDYLASVHSREAELTQTVESQMKVIIEQEYAAYIVDKAAELGWTCTARVACERSEEGLYLPVRTEVTGPQTAGVPAQLVRSIAEDLGVPEEAQVYIDKEEMP